MPPLPPPLPPPSRLPPPATTTSPASRTSTHLTRGATNSTSAKTRPRRRSSLRSSGHAAAQHSPRYGGVGVGLGWNEDRAGLKRSLYGSPNSLTSPPHQAVPTEELLSDLVDSAASSPLDGELQIEWTRRVQQQHPQDRKPHPSPAPPSPSSTPSPASPNK